MAEPIDSLEIEISAQTREAIAGLERIKASLNGFKTELNGIDTKKFRGTMQDFSEFSRKLQNLGKNVKAPDVYSDLKKEIGAVEKRLDSLLRREDKMKTVGGVDENSKSFRSLQYDIAEACGQLDVFTRKWTQ